MPSAALPNDLETLKAMLLAEQCESERLRQIIKEMQRHRFGRRAETLLRAGVRRSRHSIHCGGAIRRPRRQMAA
jgi:hypothetical protein